MMSCRMQWTWIQVDDSLQTWLMWFGKWGFLPMILDLFMKIWKNACLKKHLGYKKLCISSKQTFVFFHSFINNWSWLSCFIIFWSKMGYIYCCFRKFGEGNPLYCPHRFKRGEKSTQVFQKTGINLAFMEYVEDAWEMFEKGDVFCQDCCSDVRNITYLL